MQPVACAQGGSKRIPNTSVEFGSSVQLLWNIILVRTFWFPSYLAPANCSDPTVPRNGSVDPYQNTTEGAEIVFMCDSGLVPAGRMRAVCGADGGWNPDPAGLVCTCESMHTPLSYAWMTRKQKDSCLSDTKFEM